MHQAGKKRLLVASAAGLGLIAGLVGLITQSSQKTPQPAAVTQVVTFSTDTPDEQKPSANAYVWHGQPSDPKYIRLPTIAAEGFMQNVSIDQHNAVAVPNNIHMAGWFAESMRPGQKGLSIVDGHVDGRQSDGIFKNLIKLNKNDQFTIELGDGTIKSFKVREVKSVDAARAAEVLFSHDPAVTNQINLITCGGNFDRQTKQYVERVIVVAELTGS